MLGPIADHQRFVRQGIATLLLAGNVGAYKYSGDYFSPNPNPLVHTWSLSVEEQIYIFLPLILILILRNRKRLRKITAFLLGVISVVSFVSFLFPVILQSLYSRAGVELASQFSFYSPIDRVWQFTAGGLAFLLLDQYHNHRRNIPKGIHLLTVISVVMILFGPFHMNLKVSSIFASLFAVIVILFKSLDVLPDFLTKKLEWVGDRSYSIYLVHMPLLYLAKYSPVTQIGMGENRIVQSVIAVVASILLGALSYSKIENKYRNRGKNNQISFKTLSVALVVTFVIPSAFFVTMDRGLNSRYWGLDRNQLQPVYAGLLDANCTRDFFYTVAGGLEGNRVPCIYPINGAKKTVLLMGDSHAGMLSQAVVDAANSQQWNAVIATMGGCNVQYQQSISGQVSDKCMNYNVQMRRWILEYKPDAIILSQFVYADSLEQKDSKDAWSSQIDLRDALSKIKSIVPHLLVVENIPIFPDEKDFMIERPLVMKPYIAPKKFPMSKMQIRDQEASSDLAKWAKRNGIVTMNLKSLFCNGVSCTRYSSAGWLYRDDDHLSVIGAKLTIPGFEKYLEQL